MPVRRAYAAPLLCVGLTVLAACGGGGAPSSARVSTPGSAAPAASGSTTRSTSPTSRTPPTSPSPSATHGTASTRHTGSATSTSSTGAALPPVPRAGAEPAVRFPANESAQGADANATIGPVPDGEWARMVGYSWTPGCPVGRAQLRSVRVNFWGFDGLRSRGTVVVGASIAQQTATALTRLYDLQFRIRQMRPMDSGWGRNPKGPGADDYAAMAADNSSAFNCRYVGGQEASKVYSKHAYGTAIDVNDFENPYVADDGRVYPGTFYLHRRGPAPGVFSSSSSAAVRAFTSQGLRWGGLWSKPDYQHFDR